MKTKDLITETLPTVKAMKIINKICPNCGRILSSYTQRSAFTLHLIVLSAFAMTMIMLVLGFRFTNPWGFFLVGYTARYTIERTLKSWGKRR